MSGAGLSLSERLFRWLKNHPDEWINGGEFERMAMEVGYKGSTASRELRLLHEAGRIERKEESLSPRGVKSVWYRFSKESSYVPMTDEDKRELAYMRRNYSREVGRYIAQMVAFNAIVCKCRPDRKCLHNELWTFPKPA